MKKSIVVLLTAHNRRNITLRSLASLFSQKDLGRLFDISVVLVDDGSTDGTSDVVAKRFPQVKLIKGDGSLFWCGGMCLAYESSRSYNPDFFLLLNDDTYLYPDSIKKALDVYRNKSEDGGNEHIIVGSTCDPQTKKLTYGGSVRVSRWHPFHYSHVIPESNIQPCDTFNGNFVLIHKSVIKRNGFLDSRYTHRFGDTDYGLVAAKADCGLWVIPDFIGECEENDPNTDWDSAAYSFRDRFKMFFNVKGMPVRESHIFCRKHGGVFWPVYFVLPIIRGLFFPTHYSRN
jgi:GT2 family glycosyltransferase